LLNLRNNRAAGASGLTVEDLKRWYTKARDPQDELGGPDEEAVEIWEKVLVDKAKSCRLLMSKNV
jgi:hypothetical protein